MDLRAKVFHSPSSLEDWELLSVLWGSGTRGNDIYSTSRSLLLQSSGLVGLAQWNPERLLNFPGLGRAKVAGFIASLELSSRLTPTSHLSAYSSSSPKYPKKLPLFLWKEAIRQERETFYLLSLSRQGELLGKHVLGTGSETEVCVRKKHLAQTLFRDQAARAILAHNHPRGSFRPSEEDRILFIEAKNFLEEVEIELLDHWVLGKEGVYSIAKEKALSPFRKA
ncbi:JAB domain-containing protein [Leptospira idonii]|uniref:MPN domain-containing protein n=1 Tax=Leptospira idonii TaxID=1193500 RepID=A0A4R9LZL0_9LEPT|nr:JAB domain-containing protein [Leptospira idonii]TGN19202.1 hypothetical protein EHS15_09795 [Leptospira idonii]